MYLQRTFSKSGRGTKKQVECQVRVSVKAALGAGRIGIVAPQEQSQNQIVEHGRDLRDFSNF